MSSGNQTIFNLNQGYNTSMTTCMSAMRTCPVKADLYIPFEWLNKGISKEDVLRWVEIGCKLIFPATIIETYLNIDSIGSTCVMNLKYSKYIGLKITHKKTGSYKQHDCTELVEGSISTLTGPVDNNLRTYSNMLVRDNGSSKRHYNHGEMMWNGYAIDHQLLDTGECLLKYIRRTINEKPEEIEVSNNTFVVSIDCKKALSNNHKLAILSFYRFLWSDLYEGVVTNTLKLIDDGAEPWDALYYALSTKRYEPYYSFLQFPGWKDIEVVKSRLINGSSINISFSIPNPGKLIYTTMSVESLKDSVSKFKANNIYAIIAKNVVCVTDKLKSITKGKEYKPEISYCDKSYLIKTDDYTYKHLLKSHFKEV